MLKILNYQSIQIDFSCLVIFLSFESFRVQFLFGEFQHMRLSFRSVAHLNELTWTNNLTLQFNDVLWHNYMSVHLNYRVQLVEVVIKPVRGYQHVNVRISSNPREEKEQMSSFNWARVREPWHWGQIAIVISQQIGYTLSTGQKLWVKVIVFLEKHQLQ